MYGVDVACIEARWVYARNPQLLIPVGWLIPTQPPFNPQPLLTG